MLPTVALLPRSKSQSKVVANYLNRAPFTTPAPS
jgi:hypothetical protein